MGPNLYDPRHQKPELRRATIRHYGGYSPHNAQTTYINLLMSAHKDRPYILYVPSEPGSDTLAQTVFLPGTLNNCAQLAVSSGDIGLALDSKSEHRIHVTYNKDNGAYEATVLRRFSDLGYVDDAKLVVDSKTGIVDHAQSSSAEPFDPLKRFNNSELFQMEHAIALGAAAARAPLYEA
jgi:hypothetical protein